MIPRPVCFSEIEYEEARFLIQPYFPVGKLTIVQGDSGTGKTAFMCAITAAVSSGVSFCNSKDEPGNVLMLSVEDDPPILRGRIEADGGDLNRCFFIDHAAGLDFLDPIIEQSVKEVNAKLIIFDPIQAFIGANTDMFRANETRPILAMLADMAKENKCAVAIISHTCKSPAKAIHKALGSVDIVASARSVLHIGRDPDNSDQSVAVHIKSSNSRKGQSIRFQIGDRGRVEWLGLCDLTAEDLDRATFRKEEGIPYDDEPLIPVIRSIMAENTSGIFMSYEDFQTYAQELLGYRPCSDSYKLRSKLSMLRPEVIRNEKVQINLTKERCNAFIRFGAIYTPYNTAAARGIRLSNYSLPEQFQGRLTNL